LFGRFYLNIRHLSFPISSKRVPRRGGKCLLDLQSLETLQLKFTGYRLYKPYDSPKLLPLDVITAEKLLKNNMYSLTSLTIHNMPRRLSERISDLVGKIDTLDYLRLQDWVEPEGGGALISVLTGCQNLTTLSLQGLEILDPDDFWKLRARCKESAEGKSPPLSNMVTYLSIDNSTINMGVVLNLGMCLPNLRKLSMVGVDIKDGCETNLTDDESDITEFEGHTREEWRALGCPETAGEVVRWMESMRDLPKDNVYYKMFFGSGSSTSSSSSRRPRIEAEAFRFEEMELFRKHCSYIQVFDISDCNFFNSYCEVLIDICQLWRPRSQPSPSAASSSSPSSSTLSGGLHELRACNLGLNLVDNELFEFASYSRLLTTLDLSCDLHNRNSQGLAPFRRESREYCYYNSILLVLENCHMMEYLRVEPYPVDARMVDKPWVCKRIKALGISFESVVDSELAKTRIGHASNYRMASQIQNKVCEQQGKLTQLESIRLEGGRVIKLVGRDFDRFSPYNRIPPSTHIPLYLYLDLSLAGGLNHLAGLQKLESLGITLLGRCAWKESEIEWVASHWPKLGRLEGIQDRDFIKQLIMDHSLELLKTRERKANNAKPLKRGTSEMDGLCKMKTMLQTLRPDIVISEHLLEYCFSEVNL
ncbi:hypothetical protein BGZ50_009069, partial [Haplosporangium sp. Z 11]